MKRRFLHSAFFLLPLLAAVGTTGCVYASYKRTPLKSAIPNLPPMEAVRFHCCAVFADEKLSKVAIDRALRNGSHIGLAIGSAEEKVDSEALDNLTTAVIAGVIKGLK